MWGNRNHGQTGGSRERRHLWLLPVGFTSVIVLIFVVTTHRQPCFRLPLVDAATYHQQAAAAADGAPLAPGPFWQPPLYPYLLSVVYRTMGRDVLVVRLLHAGLVVLISALTYRVACSLLNRKLALVAAALPALYGPMLFFGVQFLPSVLAVVWNLSALSASFQVLRRRHAAWAFGTGALFGLGALTVPNILFVLPVVLVFTLLAARRDRPRTGILPAACIVAGCALVIFPVSIRNRVVGGEWVLISTNGGINLYLGNNADSAATLAVRPGIDWDRLASAPIREGQARTASQSQRVFLRRVLHFVRSRPVQFMRGLATKTRQLLSGIEIPRNLDLYSFRDASIFLRLLVWRWGPFGFPMGLVGPLALVGLGVLLGRGGVSALGASWILAYMASIVLFFPASRYMLPIVPGLLIAALAGGQRIVSDLRRPGRPNPKSTLCLLVFLVVCNLPVALPGAGIDFAAERRLYVGVALQTRGLRAAAREQYASVLATNPGMADAWFYRGTVLRELGEAEAAIASHREALRLRPDHYRAMNDLAVLLFQRKQTADAVALLRQSVERDPLNRRTMHNLVVGLVALGRVEEANTWRARLGEPPLPDRR